MQSEDTLSKYGQSFQTKVVAAILSDDRMLDTLGDVIHKKFFESEANKWIVEEVVAYYDEYHRYHHWMYFRGKFLKLIIQHYKKQ